MTIITRFSPGQTAAEIAADTVAGAAEVADSLSRGYPASISGIGLAKTREFSNLFSLSAVTNGPGKRVATSVTTADTVKMFTIPANHVLLAARLEVVTVGTGAGTFTLTDGTNTLAGPLAVITTGQSSSVTPRFYPTGATVSLTAATATIADGTYRVVVLTMDMTGQETTQLITG